MEDSAEGGGIVEGVLDRELVQEGQWRRDRG